MLSLARPADACTCFGWRDIDDMAREAPIVVVGRIVAEGEARYAGPRWIDVSIEWVAKGEVVGSPIRVWDAWADSDCGGVLKFRRDRSAVLALRRIASVPGEERAYWKDLQFLPREPDFLTDLGACAEPVKVLETRRERRRWIGRVLK
jgi:hypothetical protein